MQNSLFPENYLPIVSQNKNIIIKDNMEFCAKTGKRVLRTKKTKRPYILVDDKSERLSKNDLGILYMAFLRRIIQDASGNDLYDNTLDQEEKKLTRRYLLNGKLKEYFYTIYEHNPEVALRSYEKRFIKTVQTKEPQYSTIQIKDICEYIEKDVGLMYDLINKWKNSGWSREHYFYKSIMDSTKMVASD